MDHEEETPRERFMSSQEILSTIEWVDVLMEHTASLQAIALFDKHIATMLQALKDIKAKKFSRFLRDTVMTITRPIKALRRIREYILAVPDSDVAGRAREDKDLFNSFEERILVSVQGLVELVVDRWDGQQSFELKLSPEQDNEINNQHYLLIYLILMVLDQWVAQGEMEAATAYFEYANPKYKKFSPRGPGQTTVPKKDTRSTMKHLQVIMDLCSKSHLSIQTLLQWKPTPVFSTGVDENDDSYDEEALVEDNYPLSETGITTLVSGMIHAMTCPQDLPSSYTLPLTLAQSWFFTHAGGLASAFLSSDESLLAMSDKALSVLLYAIDRVPLDSFKLEVLDYCSIDSSLDRMGLFQIFQVMVTFASTCSISNLRFYCFQGLDRLIQGCEDSVKLYFLNQLVSNSCPFESMRAASVNLVKGTVEREFLKLDKVRVANDTAAKSAGIASSEPNMTMMIQSPFTSPMLLKTFVPVLWRLEEIKDAQQDPMRSEGAWNDRYDRLMHSLNFYLFLLMRDPRDDDVTEVWSAQNLEETQNEFLEPVYERVQELKEENIRRLALAEQAQDMELGDGDDHVPGAPGALPPLKAKNGVVNFDIDMDDDEEDDDDMMRAASQRKESPLELNQNIMRLELMDELLDRIQELTTGSKRGEELEDSDVDVE
ncbi:hypothetical protein BGZ83_010568 [Gryganskiella cystojenkinii]|nr:hypothetical protein BGZ83_010568 [Gryganskiella cystojenkinii]